jgi:hypothetical protein
MLYRETEVVLTQDTLDEKLRYWKGILGLDAWDIKIRIQRQLRMEGEQGHVEWVLQKSSAVIDIVCHDDYVETQTMWKQDMEQTLVHELLHLKGSYFDTHENGTIENQMYEQFIDHLAKILVAMDRERVTPLDNYN